MNVPRIVQPVPCLWSLPFRAALHLLFFLSLPGPALTQPVTRPHVTAELVSEFHQVVPGEPATMALRLTPDPGWHVYWKYAGDYGSAPILNWSLNSNAVPATILWPTPEKISAGPFINYGYSREVYFLTRLQIPVSEDLTGDKVSVALDAEWLVCQEECIPGFALLTLPLEIVASKQAQLPTDHADAIARTRDELPAESEASVVTLQGETENHLTIEIQARDGELSELYFIPDQPGLIENSAEQELEFFDEAARLSLKKSPNFNMTKPGALSGLLFKSPAWNEGQQALAVSIPLGSEAQSNSLAQIATGTPAATTSLVIAILSALIGGIILNIMPCVFPVLSIKILGFVEQGGQTRSSVRRHGLAFALGVVCSFWVLAVAVLLLRTAGGGIGWGFQMQNPSFVACIYLLLIAIALNLFGVFEIGAGLQRLSGRYSGAQNGYSGSFFSGVLTTALATPCTAPFLGTAVAYAFSASSFGILAVFTSIAVGLAAPYVFLSSFPAALKLLPRPGPWMERFKQAMGFPILLTALWLLWVVEKQAGTNVVFSLLLSSTILALAVWIFGHTSQPVTSRFWRRGGVVLTTIGIASAVALSVPVRLTDATSPPNSSGQDQFGLHWQPFSEQQLEELVAAGRPVYVDFTASWCVTCQLNKNLVFGSAEVRSMIAKKEVVLLQADWTRYDPSITAVLKKHGKAGVPLNLLYRPGNDAPVIFPSLISPSMVLEELKTL